MPLAAGTRLGRYEIVSPLGTGGMGEVYRARDTVLGRTVAVKVVAAREEIRADRLERFQREARAISRLNHPHICALYDVGEQDGTPYLVMEELQGQTLAERLEEGPLPLDEVLRCGLQMAQALDAAHQQGIVHRDLKPANVMLTPAGVKLLDFGLAKLRADEQAPRSQTETVTRTGLVMGTLPYMSPEQMQGGEVDARTDLFALGTLLYEMTSGRRPFAGGSDAAVIAAVLSAEPPPLSAARKETPTELQRVVARCLAKEPERRWQSARDVALELEAALGQPPGRSVSHPLRARRARVASAAGLVALVVAVGLLVGRARRPPAVPPGAPALAVLPFENLGPADDEYFADGMTDEVRGKLTALPGLVVIASTSSNQYKKTTKTPRQIADELGARYLLVGKVRWEKRPDGVRRIRVSPELVEAATAVTKWQRPFDAVLDDVFGVQAMIATQVAEALDVELGRTERERLSARPTSNLQAYEAYLQGNQAAGDLSPQNDVRVAIEHYERAVALDPGFGQAWAHLARACGYAYNQIAPSPALAERARAAAERSRALAPDLPATLVAQIVWDGAFLGDWRKAVEHFDRGMRQGSQDPLLLGEGAYALFAAGRWDDALGTARRAQRVDPRSLLIARRIVVSLLWLRRYSEALEAVDRALALAPQSIILIQNKVMIHLARGDLAAARAALAAVPREVDRATLVANFGAYWELFWVLDDEQQRLLLRLTPAQFGDDRLMWGTTLAQTAELRGDLSRARALAAQAVSAADEQLAHTPNDAQRHAFRGLALTYLGRSSEALRAGERAVAITPVTRNAYSGPYLLHQLARMYRRAGQPEKALDVLERLLAMPYYLSPGWLRLDPEWAPLREHPRFQKLLSRNPP